MKKSASIPIHNVHNVFDEAKPKGKCDMSNIYADFLLNKGLYDTIEISKDTIDDLITLISGSVKINAFCKECGEMRVFTSTPIYLYDADETSGKYNCRLLWEKLSLLQQTGFSITTVLKDGTSQQNWGWKSVQCKDTARLMIFSFTCAMNENHKLDYIVITDDYSMKKIGQYPSVADLNFPELDKYNKVMTKEDRSDMGRALGLYANGIGVGSYVYLRRIFERILLQAKESAGERIDNESFEKAHVDEKINMLKEYLPDMFTSNKIIYVFLVKAFMN